MDSTDAKIDQICEAFRRARQAGKQVSIESVIRKQHQDPLLTERLLERLIVEEMSLENHYSKLSDATIEYLNRFPKNGFEVVRGLESFKNPTGIEMARNMKDAPDRLGTHGRYRKVSLLGTGGMGRVFLYVDEDLHFRKVAIKMPHRLILIPQFVKEGKAMATVSHTHLCQIFDAGVHQGQPFIVMQYIEGRTLREHLNGQGDNVEFSQACQLTSQVARALAKLHKHRILHRDVKPENIMLDEPDSKARIAKLMDFGLAKFQHSENRSSTLGLAGTAAYMAPEVFMSTKPPSPAADIYSLGVVLYEMLSLRTPFQAPNDAWLFVKIATESPKPLDDAIPAALRAACMKALAKAPEQRFQSAEEFADRLQQIKRHLPRKPVVSRSAPSPAPSIPESPTQRIAHPWVLACVTLAVIALLVYSLLAAAS